MIMSPNVVQIVSPDQNLSVIYKALLPNCPKNY